MAGKEPLRILAFAFCAVSFALLSVAIYTDHWREQVNRSFNMHAGKAFEGLWNNCWWDSTDQTHCYPQPYNKRTTSGKFIALPSRFYFYRGLCVIGLLTNFIGLLCLMTGLKCIDISYRRKIKMQIGAGMNFVAAACCLITFILFKINEWGSGNANASSSLGKGMYLLIAAVIFQVIAVVLAITGMESDDADYMDEEQSRTVKPYQPGSIVNQGGSSYI